MRRGEKDLGKYWGKWRRAGGGRSAREVGEVRKEGENGGIGYRGRERRKRIKKERLVG